MMRSLLGQGVAMSEDGRFRRRDLFGFAVAAVAGILVSAVGLRALAAPREGEGRASPAHTRQNGLATSVVRSLSKTERQILRLYYGDGMTPKEIGAVLGLSESQVCQTHAAMLERMRAAVRKA